MCECKCAGKYVGQYSDAIKASEAQRAELERQTEHLAALQEELSNLARSIGEAASLAVYRRRDR